MKTLKKILLIVFLAGQLSLVSGCGTITRGESYKSSYRGFEQDKRVVSNPYYWILSFGIAPLFSIASMPIDIVVDTILYPYDKWHYERLMKSVPAIE